jgi:hypothetical protein
MGQGYRAVAIALAKKHYPKNVMAVYGMTLEQIVDTLERGAPPPQLTTNEPTAQDYRTVAITLHKRLWPLGDGSLRGGEDNAAAWVDAFAKRLAGKRAPPEFRPEITEDEVASGFGKLFKRGA